ncbi:MAG: GTPase [Lachnospiraceae bacterium]|nr:GTPase [Lachnospiraceae bacterium]MCI7043160.1 GTPase [Lachnospiraceae bacterium]MDD7628020.1 GTP-binding protein [Lachnospiraceae bacterium]MDY4119801.1 GTP-binding protein [Lachnospiraceae bacterium]
MKPVYVINGFLESGKTEFICYTLAQPYFQIKGRTLLIVCEEGEVEYDEKLLARSRTDMVVIDEEEDFNTSHLIELEKKYRPERIIIEYNGMWNFKNMKLPWHWTVEQQITTVDASTFPMYFTNMKSLLAEMIRKSEMIIFNRCDGVEDLSVYKRNVKAINQQADIIFEDSQGEVNQIFEDDLPYNLNDPIIELDNQGYGIWYLDSLDNLDRYIGKTIQFTAMVLKPKEFPKGFFIPGRMAMTCCAEDMAFLGFACEYDKADTLTEKQWVKVTAKVDKEYFADYEGEGPVLKAISVEQTKAPKEPVISFT